MIPLHEDPDYVFRFADSRRVGRFHLDGVPPGTAVVAYDLETGAELARAAAGDGGWVELATPLIVRPGGGFRVRRA